MNKKVWWIIGVLVLLIMQKLIGAFSVNFFTAIDNILEIHPAVPPVLMWAIYGLFVGAIAGSLVIWAKYKLAFKWNFLAIGVFIVVTYLLFILSSPLSTAQGHQSVNKPAAMIKVSAAHSLPDYKQYNYKAENLIDQDGNTAWMYMRDKSNPETVWYVFTKPDLVEFTNPEVTGLQLKNGYSKNHDKWRSYNRLKDFTVYHNRKLVYSGTAADKYNIVEDIVFNQQIPVNEGDTISVFINSVYRGSNKKADITAISEMVPLVNYQKR